MSQNHTEKVQSKDNANQTGRNWTAHNTQGVQGWAVAVPHPSGDGSFYAPIVQGLSEEEAKLIAAAPKLKEELENIRDAKPRSWEDPSDFTPWAQNRARHTLESIQPF